MLRFTVLAALLLVSLYVLSCSAEQQNGPIADIGPTGFHEVINPLPTPGEDFGFSDTDDKAASAAYLYFFHDAVNHHSGGRWSVGNQSGAKAWRLSNLYFTEPKAWQMGGNYWNNENDTLTSNPGVVGAGRKGIKLGFHGRWKIAAGDGCSVQYSIDNGEWTEIAFFTGGQNPGYPAWDRYTLGLPDCGLTDQEYRVRFAFTSNGAGNDVGFGVDRLAIYQTLLTPPNIDPSNEEPNQLTVYITHNFDGERPGVYDIYRSDDGEFGTYNLVGSTDYPGTMFSTSWVDGGAAAGNEYWYKVKSTKEGWDDSEFSEADWGTYIFE